MRRRVRVEDAALVAVVEQLAGSAVTSESFVTQDLVREVGFLEEHYDVLPISGPGRRHTQHEPETVALFHVFAALDDAGTVVVYHIDIWVAEPPEPPSGL